MTNLIPFQFESNEIRVVVDDRGEPLFVGKDVCQALGYANANKAMRDHCKGITVRYPLLTPGGMQEVRVLTESDVYRLVIHCTLPAGEAFEAWIMEEILPSIRKTGKYEAPKKASASPSMKDSLLFLKESAKMLRMSETSVNKGLRVIADVYNMPSGLLPSYSTEGLVQSLSDLLKSHNIPMSAVAANKILIEKGYLTVLQRRTSGNKMEDFKSITEKGLKYGRNDTPPECPNKTNPQWYVDKFSELAEILIKSSDEKSAK
jgi:prophage antirepressor-like protein